MFRPFTFRFLQPGFIAMLFLFSTARVHAQQLDSIQYYRSTMQAAKAIICDLRGYPNGNYIFLEWLMREKDTKDWIFVQVIIKLFLPD
jgi:hypothetical protein